MSSAKKVLASILLGGLNSFLLIIIPFLIANRYTHEILDSINTYLTNVFGEFLIGILVIGGLLALFIWMLIKYFNILSNSTLIESLVCSIFYIISWIIVMFLMVPISNLENFWVFAIFIVLFYIIVFVVIYIISIIIIFKAFSKDKKIFVLISGLLIYISIPILLVMTMFGSFVNLYSDEELLINFESKYNLANSEIISINSTDKYYCEDIDDMMCGKGGKEYLIKSEDNTYYEILSYVSSNIIPKKTFKVLSTLTSKEYEFTLKEKEIYNNIENIAIQLGYNVNYDKHGNTDIQRISESKSSTFLSRTTYYLWTRNDVTNVDYYSYEHEGRYCSLDITISDYDNPISINVCSYAEITEEDWYN